MYPKFPGLSCCLHRRVTVLIPRLFFHSGCRTCSLGGLRCRRCCTSRRGTYGFLRTRLSAPVRANCRSPHRICSPPGSLCRTYCIRDRFEASVRSSRRRSPYRTSWKMVRRVHTLGTLPPDTSSKREVRIARIRRAAFRSSAERSRVFPFSKFQHRLQHVRL